MEILGINILIGIIVTVIYRIKSKLPIPLYLYPGLVMLWEIPLAMLLYPLLSKEI